MTRRAIVLAFIRWSVVFGLFHFLGDLVGAWLAIGWLFDPSVDGFVLLLGAPLAVAFSALIVGGAVGSVFPRRWCWAVPPRGKAGGITLFLIVVVVGGYTARVGRQLSPPVERERKDATGRAPVLWVVLDTLRADTLYGEELDFKLAPELGQFAREALVFKDAESTAGWTIPATAALMTGIHNLTMDASAGRLPKWAPTIAEHLYRAGYGTHAVVDNVIVEPRVGFGAGFESFFQRSAFRFVFSLPGFRLLPEWVQMQGRRKLHSFYYGARGVTDEALRVLDSVEESPLFLYVHYMDPHAPYNHHPHLGPLPPGSEEINFYDWRIALHNDGETRRPTPGQHENLLYRYGNEVTHMSAEIGRLLKAWRERFGESGMIVFTSDHGEEFLEHGHYGHGHTVHREVVHVPLLMRFPKGALSEQSSRGVVEHPVSLIDVLPTTLEAIGVTPVLEEGEFPIQGQSMVPWLSGVEPFSHRPLISSHSRHKRRVYRYREGSETFMKTTWYNGDLWSGFYRLDEDNAERSNLIESGVIKDSKVKVASVKLDNLGRNLWKAKATLSSQEKLESEESLRAIGYIQ